MDDFVKKQLNHIGFTEDSHQDIWLAFRDINEADFRGMTIQKIRQLIPNRLEVQMEILAHIEVLRVNAALTSSQLNHTNSSQFVDESQNPLVSTKVEVKAETVNYSSDSDIEILSSDDETMIVNDNPQPNDKDTDEPVIILESVQPRSRRPIKRAHLINLNDTASGSTPPKVSRTEASQSEHEVGGPDQSVASSSSPTANNYPRNTYSIPHLKTRKTTVVKLSNPELKFPRTQRTVKPLKSSNVDLAEKSLANTIDRKKVTTKHNYEMVMDAPTVTTNKSKFVDKVFIKSIKGVATRNGSLSTGRRYSIDRTLKAEDLVPFYDQFGKYIQYLELFSWSWRNEDESVVSSKRESWWTTDLGKILYVLCPEVQVLKLRGTPRTISGNTEISFSEQIRQLPNLKDLVIDCSSEVLSQLEIILKAGKTIGRCCFVFEDIDDVTGILNLMQKLSKNNFLQELTSFSVRTRTGEWGSLFLTSAHFVTLSRCNFPKLTNLKIDCNFREECKDAFEGVLKNFSASLKVFRCFGSFFGTVEDSTFTLDVPKMDNLTHFSLGHNYTLARLEGRNLFLVNRQAEEVEVVKSANVAENVTEEQHLLSFHLKMCNIFPAMKTLQTGSVCAPDMHFSSFPALEKFEVGGPWDRTVKIPSSSSRHSNYPKIGTIKIPELIENECIISDLPRVFPNLTKVSMKFPTARCLKNFFKVMVNSKLRELDLQTDFCFSWTLREILIGKEHGGERPMAELKMAQDLMKYKDFKEFVWSYRVDFPFDILDPNDPDFEPREESTDVAKRIEFFNRQLYMRIKHLGRRLEIPKGNFSFKDPKCEYFEEKIGFITDYPLATRNLIKGFSDQGEKSDDTGKWEYSVENIILSD